MRRAQAVWAGKTFDEGHKASISEGQKRAHDRRRYAEYCARIEASGATPSSIFAERKPCPN
jgi:hypothetical protein